jgi:protein-glutamine gamma-glutamyltransferase
MSVLEAIRRANQAGVPEDSIRLRAACTGVVLVALAACSSQSELSRSSAVVAGALVVCGMVFSYVTRARPPAWIKLLVAAGAISVLLWFFHQVSMLGVADIASVETPLTALFAWIQVAHSFHVPCRRDLVFSLGGAAGLMAVGAAQAIDLEFALYVVPWLAFSLWALIEMWASASGGGRISTRALGSALAGIGALTAIVFLLLPAPTVAIRVAFQTRAGSGGAVSQPGKLAGDSGSAAELSKAGSPASKIGVGGYLGFAGRLDTAIRGKLGHTVVMRVRAQRPSYWVGETYDRWDGQSWSATAESPQILQSGSPFVLPGAYGAVSGGQADLQTFYVTTSTPDLVFHAETASQVWLPTSSAFYYNDGTVVSPIGLGKGTIYTVESQVTTASPAELRQDPPGLVPGDGQQHLYTELPHPYPQVAGLAQSITRGDTSTYAKVESLIAWMGANTRYSTDIPPLPAGEDTVNEFLFGNRTGYCEQISTSLAVMLRTLGIPAREAVGYVPGPYNPVTDLYEIQAQDAHAWVQVWFPGYGWQSFDPTAVVPDANPSPGATALRDVGRAFSHIPFVPLSAVLAVAVAVVATLRWRRRRPATWAHDVARRMERAGRRAGRPRGVGETIGEYGAALDALSGPSGPWRRLGEAVESSAYGGCEPDEDSRRLMLAEARRSRVPRRGAVERREQAGRRASMESVGSVERVEPVEPLESVR